MNATNDVILCVLKGPYQWSDVATFANSIKHSGYKGKKIFLVSGITSELRQKLTDEGFELVDYFRFPEREMGSFCGARFWPINDFLKERAAEFRYLFHVDWRDLVVQVDPSAWMEKHLGPDKLLGCTEGMRVEEEYYNDWWLKQAAPDHATYEMARRYDILCAGTIAGEALAMRDLLCAIYDVLNTSPLKPDYEGGLTPPFDQGILNYIVRLSPFKEILRVPRLEEGFTASVSWYITHRWTNREVPVMKDGLVYPQGKAEPFCILHQYDRCAIWKAAVVARYADGVIPAPAAPPENTTTSRWLRKQ